VPSSYSGKKILQKEWIAVSWAFFLKLNIFKNNLMSLFIFREDLDKTYYSGEGCYINERFNVPQVPFGSIAKAIVKPGMITENHTLTETDEWYYILEGLGRMYLNGQCIGDVHPGDIVHIPKNTPQYIKNTGKTDLVFLCFCSPAFNMVCYKKVLTT
jgi:quercetin dioxygenase-like cupin family protein